MAIDVRRDARLNKPRVFLSHSRADGAFIERLSNDLRGCQIDPWLDTEEIRHGKPWLDSIFESGIPTCDSVLVYFTENSIESPMVKKEIDAALLQQLKDSGISFLPYVSDEKLREKLRPDIQALQVLVLNKGNYSELLPRIVAEIWRSFLERTVDNAIKTERVHRLEAELELEKLKQKPEGEIFTASEERDFEYIRQQLERLEPILVREVKRNINKINILTTYQYEVSLLSILPYIWDSNFKEYPDTFINGVILDSLKPGIMEYGKINGFLEIRNQQWMIDKLIMYGLVDRIPLEKPDQELISLLNELENKIDNRLKKNLSDLRNRYVERRQKDALIFNKRLQRFKYWLDFKGLTPPRKIVWRKLGDKE